MSFWQTWLAHPQSLGFRKLLFQLHLWIGISIGLYVLMMSITGTALIYRVELSKRFSREPAVITGGNPRMTVDQLKAAAQRAYPQYEVAQITQRRNPNLAVEISLRNGQNRTERLFNPFTGADLGDSVTPQFRVLMWVVSLHDNLLVQPAGRFVNGIGAVLVTLLCFSGAIVWWPGSGKWRRRLTVDWKADRHRLNWALHYALGFWSIGFVLMWGISGIYLCFPEMFNKAIDYFDPVIGTASLRFPDQFLAWLSKAHFGRFGGLSVKLVWTVFGLLPAVLMVTGFVMWWHRVLRPMLRRALTVRSGIKGAEPEAGD